MTQQLILTRPDDWHLHLRDGEQLKAVLPHTAARFSRAIVMPNLGSLRRLLAKSAAPDPGPTPVQKNGKTDATATS